MFDARDQRCVAIFGLLRGEGQIRPRSPRSPANSGRESHLGGVSDEDTDCSALPSRHIAGGSGDAGLALGASKLPLKSREGLD